MDEKLGAGQSIQGPIVIEERLQPNRDLLRKEYVLVQAWKKTAAYIRYHNWFSDTLASIGQPLTCPPFWMNFANA